MGPILVTTSRVFLVCAQSTVLAARTRRRKIAHGVLLRSEARQATVTMRHACSETLRRSRIRMCRVLLETPAVVFSALYPRGIQHRSVQY